MLNAAQATLTSELISQRTITRWLTACALARSLAALFLFLFVVSTGSLLTNYYHYQQTLEAEARDSSLLELLSLGLTLGKRTS